MGKHRFSILHIWNSITDRLKKHFKDFRYIWVILFGLTLGIVLLYPTMKWGYRRILLIILITFLIWSPLKNIYELKGCWRLLWGVLMLIPILILFHLELSPLLPWAFYQWWCGVLLFALTALLVLHPMNAVYGLMGTSGSIRLFFFNFVVISLIFSSIYYFGFFKNAGITYDVNQPHIDFMKYAVTTDANSTEIESQIIVMSTKRDTVYVEHQLDSISYTETIIQTQIIRDTIMPPVPLNYQPIDFWQVWRSTILTTLTQESADLLSIATVHNEAMKSTNPEMDKEKSELFEWILIFHIIISWIFFGVFISLLYNKFRYES